MYAEVIVDVPAQQTDRPFTYEVPREFTGGIECGMRVIVPFGKLKRQGFIIGLTKEAPTFKTRPIEKVLDLSPVLTEELLALADYMCAHTFAFKITCLETMLPAAFKARYEKNILRKTTVAEVVDFFEQAEAIPYDTAEARGMLPQLLEWQKKGWVDVEYEVQQKGKVKTERLVLLKHSAEEYRVLEDNVRKNALQQRALLARLADSTAKKAIPAKKLIAEGIKAATLQAGAQKGWISFEEAEVYRDPYQDEAIPLGQPLTLNPEQQTAFTKIAASMEKAEEAVYLLEGITGSGKTEVYLQAIAQALAAGKQAILLVPEIALTPQMVERFKHRFGEAVAVLHSGLSQGEKYDEWRKIQRQEAQIVVGARSAIFAPFRDLGLIILDEEHESSYKQEEMPRYHARDLAIWRAKYHHCPVVLGSATPSLESRARAQKNVYHLLRLTQRAQNAHLPAIGIVDQKKEYNAGNSSEFSEILREKISDRLEKGEQTVLLLNRRGYSSFMICRECGYVLTCPNCDISLTLHKDIQRMKCHYCGHEERVPDHCPQCGSKKIRFRGSGTQKIEETLHEIVPEARILRMDVDTTRRKGAHKRILNAFGRGDADILLGTQMIAKGLDYPNVTLVGVLNADTALNLPDFRAAERTFQLLSQVSGRAGRGKKQGEVVIQTFNPEHYAIQWAKAHDYEGFYRQEMRYRHLSDYPPFYYTIALTVSHKDPERAARKIYQLADGLKSVLSPQGKVLGPTPKEVFKVKQRYYYQILIKYKQEPQLLDWLHKVLNESQEELRRGLRLSIDVDPL